MNLHTLAICQEILNFITRHLITSGQNLANELKKSNLYLTGSLNEPRNHHIEAAQCGLPILYIDSGGMQNIVMVWS